MEGSNFSLLIKKFSRYKLGLIFFILLVLMYLIVILSGFIAPYGSGAPYANQNKELFDYYKDKSLHMPTLPQYRDGKWYVKEYKRLKKPGFSIFKPIGLERTLKEVADYIKADAVESIINNYPTKGNKPTYLINLINKLSGKNKAEFIKLVNKSQEQKQYISEIVLNTIDDKLRARAAKAVISKDFSSYEEFYKIVSDLKERENFSDKKLREIYSSNFQSKDGIKVVNEVIKQKEGMVLSQILRFLGVGDINQEVSIKRKVLLFDDILYKIDEKFKKDIYVRTNTYKLDETPGFEGNLIKFEKFVKVYDKLKEKHDVTKNYFEKDLALYDQLLKQEESGIIKEAIIEYLGLETIDDTLENYYDDIEDSDYFENLPEEKRNFFINKFENNYEKRLKEKNYLNVKDELPKGFTQVIENSGFNEEIPSDTVSNYYKAVLETDYFKSLSDERQAEYTVAYEKRIDFKLKKELYALIKNQLHETFVEITDSSGVELNIKNNSIDDLYTIVKSSNYYDSLDDSMKNGFRTAYNKIKKNGDSLEEEHYNEIKEQLDPQFREIVENSPKYHRTVGKGLILTTPSYIIKKWIDEYIQNEIPQDVYNSDYEKVKDKLPEEIVNLINDFQNTDFTVRDFFEDLVPNLKERVPDNDFTSLNSRDDLQNENVTKELLKIIPNSIADIFHDYIDFSGKTVKEIFQLIPYTNKNEKIPTLGTIIKRKYINLLGNNNADKSPLDLLKSNNEHFINYMRYYIKQERLHYEHELGWFVKGEEYTLFWVFKTDVHLFGTKDKKAFYLMGADKQGRCIFSRIVHGGIISLTVGFLGMFLSLTIAITIGGLAGFFGGWVDWIIMRICEIVMLFPSFYLLLTLRGVLPTDMSSEQRFILIVFILSLMQWAGTARVIRGFILSGKNQDFVTAAKIAGIPTPLVILKHLLPQISSYLIVTISIGIPSYIIYETSLSWLGFGISEPAVSWGLMLSGLRERSIESVFFDYPWLLWPVFFVALAVMCFQLVGDAIRDTLDPMVKR